MNAPDSFKKLAQMMHQDSDAVARGLNVNIYQYLTMSLLGNERAEASNFIDLLLTSNTDPHFLRELWADSGSDLLLRAEDMNDFLVGLRSELRQAE